MNKLYRTIWNEATQTWAAVAENAKGHGKTQSTGQPVRWGVLTAAARLGQSLLRPLVLSLCAAGVVHAAGPAVNQLPTGGQVVAGQASMAQSGAATLNVNQSSASAVINWNTFNLGSAATVNFVQPSSSSATLNRVLDSNPSQIYGRITAPGQVFFSNQSGIYFGQGASADVGGLTATTHSISNADFMAGNYRFTRDGATGAVVNEGELKSSLGGYIALLAPEVRNQGVIVARLGTVALAAGEDFELQMQGTQLSALRVTPATIKALVDNALAVQAPGGLIILSAQALNQLQGGVVNTSGALQANALVQRNGRIVLDASDKISVSGQLQANSDTGKGGEITLTAQHIALQAGAQLEATGATGGGTVLVGGDWQGSGNLRQATTVTLQAGASIDASATQSGDGGKVVLWSDVHNSDSRTEVQGSLTAQGGAAGGNGGNIETSGARVQIGDGVRVSTMAAAGKTGNWLIDPIDFTIAAGSGAQTTSGIGATTIQNGLATANVSITTNSSTAGNGDIFVNSDVAWSANRLTLTASRTININANLAGTGTSSLTLSGVGVTGTGGIATGAGVTFTTTGASTYSGVISAGSVTKSGVGTLTLAGSNTYSGATTVNTGILQAGSATAFGSNSAVSMASTAGVALDLNGNSVSIGSLAGGGPNGGHVTLGTGTLTVGALNTNTSYAGVISGTGGLTKTGTGTQTLTNASNSYTGATTVSQGTLQIGFNSVSGISADSAVSVASGATLKLYLTGTATFASNIDFAGTVNFAQTGTTTASGIISGSGVLTQSGSGTTNLTGTNTYTGGTTISAGKINVNAVQALGPSGTITFAGGRLQYGSGGTTTDYASRLSGTALIDTNGQNVTWTSAFGGTALTKLGTGTLTLGAVNTYTGATSISGGIVQAGVDGAFSSGSAVTLDNTSGVALDVNGKTVTIASLAGGGTTGGNVTLGAGTLTTGGNNTSTTYAGVISGDGGLTKTGTGTQTLTGNSTYTGTTTISAGGLVIQNDAPTTASSQFSGPGSLTIASSNASFTSAFSTTGWNFDSVNPLGGLTIGKTGNTAAITVANATTVAGQVNLLGGDIAINGAITATNNTIALTSSGNVTQTGALTASNLLLSGGSVMLNNTSNAIDTLAANGVSALSFVDANALTLGTVGGTNGITATGVVNIATVSGDLTVSQAVSTTNTSATALTLNAGSGSSAGTSTGGNVVFSGAGAASVGTDGTATIFTGSLADSGAVTLVSLAGGSGSGRFRYGSDESTSNYTLALSTGLNVIYREQPTITRAVDNKTITYGDVLPSFTFTSTGNVNGDSLTTILSGSTAPTVAVGGTLNSNNRYNAGAYNLTGTAGSSLSQLGYAITNSATAGTLTINKAALTVTADNKSRTYGGANPTLSTTVSGFVNGENLATSGVSGSGAATTTATSATGAGTAVITAAAGTLSADNYEFTNLVNGVLTINKAALTVTANDAIKTQDGHGYQGGNGVQYAGLVGAETSAVLSGILGYGGTSQGAVVPGDYDITPQGLTAANYQINGVAGKLTVNPAVLPAIPMPAQPIQTTPAAAPDGGQAMADRGCVTGRADAAFCGNGIQYFATSAANGGAASSLVVMLPKTMVTASDGSISVAVPARLFKADGSNQPLRMTDADGKAIPNWLIFDSEKNTLTISNSAPSDIFPMRLLLAKDGESRVVDLIAPSK